MATKSLIKLYPVQRREVDRAHRNWIYVMDPGTGKTFTSLAHYKKWADGSPLVVIAPKAVLEPTNQWIEAIDQFFGANQPSYETFKTDEIKKLPYDYFKGKYVIVDEVHKFKTVSHTQRSDQLRMMLIRSSGFCFLSGTLATGDLHRTPTEVQLMGGFRKIKGKKPIPDSRWEEMANYFAIFQVWQQIHNEKNMYWTFGHLPKTWTPFTTRQLAVQIVRSQAIEVNTEMRGNRFTIRGYKASHKYLSKWLHHVSSNIIKLDDVAELPEYTAKKVEFKASSEYKKPKVIFDNPVQKRVWQRQHQNNKAKLDWLANYLDGTRQNVIVFYSFHDEADRIKKIIPKDKKIYEISGKKHDSLTSITNNAVILVQNDAGGSGLNVQMAPISIWFSYPDSYINWKQSKFRNYRIGQKHKVIHYHLHVNGTIDDRMRLSLDQKKDFRG